MKSSSESSATSKRARSAARRSRRRCSLRIGVTFSTGTQAPFLEVRRPGDSLAEAGSRLFSMAIVETQEQHQIQVHQIQVTQVVLAIWVLAVVWIQEDLIPSEIHTHRLILINVKVS